MDDPRPEKVAVVDEVRERLSSANAALLTEYRGLGVGELARLRRSLREAGGEYKIYKNTLVRFAVRELGLDGLETLLVGPTAITFVETDAASVAKALRDFARTNPNLVVKGGLLGAKVLSAADAGALAELPSRDLLLAQLAGAVAAPLQTFAGLLQALIDKQGGVPEAPAPEAPAPEPTEQLEGAEQLEAAAPEAAADVADEAPTSDAGESPVDTEPAPEPQEDQ